MDRRVDTNLTAYFIDWSDIEQQIRRVSDAGSFITNAGGAETKGIEVEVRAMANSQLDVGINLSIQDSKITELSESEAAFTEFLLGTSGDLCARFLCIRLCTIHDASTGWAGALLSNRHTTCWRAPQ